MLASTPTMMQSHQQPLPPMSIDGVAAAAAVTGTPTSGVLSSAASQQWEYTRTYPCHQIPNCQNHISAIGNIGRLPLKKRRLMTSSAPNGTQTPPSASLSSSRSLPTPAPAQPSSAVLPPPPVFDPALAPAALGGTTSTPTTTTLPAPLPAPSALPTTCSIPSAPAVPAVLKGVRPDVATGGAAAGGSEGGMPRESDDKIAALALVAAAASAAATPAATGHVSSARQLLSTSDSRIVSTPVPYTPDGGDGHSGLCLESLMQQQQLQMQQLYVTSPNSQQHDGQNQHLSQKPCVAVGNGNGNSDKSSGGGRQRIHHPPLKSPLPGGCHGRTSRNNSYCRRIPCYNGSQYCKLHYQQYCAANGGVPPPLAESDGATSAKKSLPKVRTSSDVTSAVAASGIISSVDVVQQPLHEQSNGSANSVLLPTVTGPQATQKINSGISSSSYHPHHADKRYTGTNPHERRCGATTTRGRTCAYVSVNGTKYCHLHADYDTNPPPRRGGCHNTNSASGNIVLGKASSGLTDGKQLRTQVQQHAALKVSARILNENISASAPTIAVAPRVALHLPGSPQSRKLSRDRFGRFCASPSAAQNSGQTTADSATNPMLSAALSASAGLTASALPALPSLSSSSLMSSSDVSAQTPLQRSHSENGSGVSSASTSIASLSASTTPTVLGHGHGSTAEKSTSDAGVTCVHSPPPPYPLLNSIASDRWSNRRVLISTGPLINRTGRVVKWGNGWVTVRIMDGTGAPSDDGEEGGLLHNRRAIELCLLPEENGKGLGECNVSRHAKVDSQAPLRKLSSVLVTEESKKNAGIQQLPRSPDPQHQQPGQKKHSPSVSVDHSDTDGSKPSPGVQSLERHCVTMSIASLAPLGGKVGGATKPSCSDAQHDEKVKTPTLVFTQAGRAAETRDPEIKEAGNDETILKVEIQTMGEEGSNQTVLKPSRGAPLGQKTIFAQEQGERRATSHKAAPEQVSDTSIKGPSPSQLSLATLTNCSKENLVAFDRNDTVVDKSTAATNQVVTAEKGAEVKGRVEEGSKMNTATEGETMKVDNCAGKTKGAVRAEVTCSSMFQEGTMPPDSHCRINPGTREMGSTRSGGKDFPTPIKMEVDDKSNTNKMEEERGSEAGPRQNEIEEGFVEASETTENELETAHAPQDPTPKSPKRESSSSKGGDGDTKLLKELIQLTECGPGAAGHKNALSDLLIFGSSTERPRRRTIHKPERYEDDWSHKGNETDSLLLAGTPSPKRKKSGDSTEAGNTSTAAMGASLSFSKKKNSPSASHKTGPG